MYRDYDKQMNHKPLQLGDLVLRKMKSVGRVKEDGKLPPNREGPYNICEVLRDGTYKLEEGGNGRSLSHPWNTNNLRKYYARITNTI